MMGLYAATVMTAIVLFLAQFNPFHSLAYFAIGVIVWFMMFAVVGDLFDPNRNDLGDW